MTLSTTLSRPTTLPRPARIGALCLTAAAPLFLLANVVTALGWRNPPFSWATHNISDLGNVHCGVWDTTRPRYVCSPWHPLMNASFVLTALLLIVGFVLAWRLLCHGVAPRVAAWLFLLAAVGYALAGAYPADVNENLHFLAALLILVLGNIGLPLAAFAPAGTVLGEIRPLTLVAAVVALAGSVLFLTQQPLGIGVGAMERVAAFPFLIWASCVGVFLLVRSRTPRRVPVS